MNLSTNLLLRHFCAAASRCQWRSARQPLMSLTTQALQMTGDHR